MMKDLLADLASGNDGRAEQAIPAIRELGEDVIPALLELTRSESADVRWWAVRALAESPHVQAGHLAPLLRDPAPEVRAAAALSLCDHPNESAVPSLIEAMADEDPLVAGLAGNALVKIGRPSVESLLTVMNESSMHVRIHALRALAEIRDHRAIPVMMKCMDEDSAVLQYWAQEGLERLGLDMVYMKP